MINERHYQRWQQRLRDSLWYRRFWVASAIYLLVTVFAVGIILLVAGQWKVVDMMLLAFILGRLIVSPLIYLGYKKQRPYQKFGFLPPVSALFFSTVVTRHTSFPSDHAVSFAAISTVLFLFYPVAGILMFVMSFLNGIARVVVGYHYLTDIIAGWALGVFSALFVVYWLAPRLFT